MASGRVRDLLMVAYDFPPSTVGIWRTLKFCRYMGDHGWRPHILTVKPIRAPRYDWRPMAELPEGTAVRRTGSLDQNRLAFLASKSLQAAAEPGARVAKTGGGAPAQNTNATARRIMDVLRGWALIPDDRMGWLPFAVSGGAQWLREQRFDAIYSTCYPHTAHVGAAMLAKRFGVPFLADFRDIWIGSYVFYHPATSLHDWAQRRLERMVVSRAGRVLAATEPITRDFHERYPDLPRDRFATLTNGWDDEDIAAITPRPDTEHFTLTYAGTLFNSASPEGLFEAVRQLLDAEPEWRDVLRLRFLGSMIEPFRQLIRTKGLEPITTVQGYLPHDEALQAMADADALLLIISPEPGSHIMLTQKVFEYAAVRRPIVGLVPDGAAHDFLAELGEGPIAHPTDVPTILAALRAMLQKWRQFGRLLLPPNPVMGRYHRRNLTGELCRHLDEITAHRQDAKP